MQRQGYGLKLLAVTAAVMIFWGCSGSNSGAPSLDVSGHHPAGWIQSHGRTFIQDTRQCSECHGSDLRGGISLVSCFSANRGTQTCHATGPAPHALPFADKTLHAAVNASPKAKNDLTFCQGCHGQAGGAGSNPRFNTAMSTYTNGCETCHASARAHPTSWQGFNNPPFTHRDVPPANLSVSCVLCHGVALNGAGGVGPSCATASYTNQAGSITTCHFNGAGSQPFHPPAATWISTHALVARINVGNCLECHQDSTSSSVITISGVLNGIPVPGCASCHLGGASTVAGQRIIHPDGAPIASQFGLVAGTPTNGGIHKAYLDGNGKNATSCALTFCHGTALTGGTAPTSGSWGIGPSCLTCHGKVWTLP